MRRTQMLAAAIMVGTAWLAAAPCALAQAAQFDLANYRHTRTHALFVPEASAVAWNPDRQSIFVIGDGGVMIAEFNRFGTGITMINLSGFDDTEGIAYVGNGRFAVVEERIQRVSLLTWPTSPTPIVTINQSSLPSVTLGPNVGNSGLEGICLDPLTGEFFIVKEKDPQRVLRVGIDFPAASHSIAEQCPSGPLGVSDLSDIAVLYNVPPLANSPDRENLLIISQASNRLVEATRAGVVQSTFTLTGISSNNTIEGVTIDDRGVIYLVDESPSMYVLEPCRANFNWDGGVSVQDIFDFLAAYFGNDPRADINHSGGISVQDIFEFLSAYFMGC